MKNEVKDLVRCAIYTRKSVAEGSEQDFTSLDAQRESAESYIASQKSQGWVVLKEKYDDFGYSGATMDRPALEKLIADIKAKKFDCVVVYKVDRLSRSLLDFAKLLQLFEDHNVTFVSVTQHFNTNNSMGRLTLNILLSFAQFEREIISERTRDKMGAARMRGKWMGGRPPLGYDLDKESHKLVINPKEAKIIREAFDLYIQKRSLLDVTRIFNKKGYRTKTYLRKGQLSGGIKLKKTNIQLMLQNAIYIGKVNYGGKIYEGEHKAIIDEETFQKVKEIRDYNNRNKFAISKSKTPKGTGLLSRMVKCKACDCSMLHTYGKKRNNKYLFYLCSNANKRGYASCPTKTVNARRLEYAVADCLRKICPDFDIPQNEWDQTPMIKQRAILETIIKEVDCTIDTLGITLLKDPKRHEFKVNLKQIIVPPPPPKEETIKQEPPLRQNLILAHQIQELMDKGEAKDLKQVTRWLNMDLPRTYQIMNFLLLAPSIQEKIMLSENKQIFNIPEYKIRQMMAEVDWKKQIEEFESLSNKTNQENL
jgi:DNA invertase Pin-like site-specific DNA recombinase